MFDLFRLTRLLILIPIYRICPTRRRGLSLFRDSSFSSEDYDEDENVLASMQNSTWGGELILTRTGALV